MRTLLMAGALSAVFAASAGAAPNPSINVKPATIPFGQSFTVTGKHWPVIEFCSRTMRFSLRSTQNAFRIGTARVTKRGKFTFTYKVKQSVVGGGDWLLRATQPCESGEDGHPTPIKVSAPIHIGPVNFDDVLQVAGALLILIPFAALQFGRMSASAPLYLWLNLVGSGLLAVLAVKEEQWGFVLLEVVWAAVAAWSLVRPSAPGPAAHA